MAMIPKTLPTSEYHSILTCESDILCLEILQQFFQGEGIIKAILPHTAENYLWVRPGKTDIHVVATTPS